MAGILVLLLLVLPFVEVAVFVAAVGWVGFLPSLVAVVVLGTAGALLVRQQGLGVWRRARSRLRAGEVPSAEVVNGLLVLAAGLLLLLPGFVSDVAAIALLLPPVRSLVRSLLFRRFEERMSASLAGPASIIGSADVGRSRMDAGRARLGGAVEGRVVGGDAARPGPTTPDGSGRPTLGRP